MGPGPGHLVPLERRVSRFCVCSCVSSSVGGENVELPQPSLDSWEPVPAELLEGARVRWAAASQGDLEPMLERWAADCEVHSGVARVVEGEAGVFRGHEGLREFWLELQEAFADFVFVPSEMRRRGSLTLMIGRSTGRGGASGIEIDVPMFWLTQQNEQGQNIWGQAFRELDEALEAAAVREARGKPHQLRP